MMIYSLAFTLGICLIQLCAHLPSPTKLIFLGLLSFIIGCYLRKQSIYSFLPFISIIGAIWVTWYASHILAFTLPTQWEGKPLRVTGVINSLPTHDPFGTVFEFYTNTISYEDKSLQVNTVIRLRWQPNNQSHTSPQFKPGEHWQLLVKLKRIHALQSPGAFDFEAWALQKGLRATGVVVDSPFNSQLHASKISHLEDQWRLRVREKMINALSNKTSENWLIALMVGERNGISANDWEVLRNTGTNHLMAIGGLHIGMVAGAAHLFLIGLWRRFPRGMLWIPAQHVGAVAALFAALFYSSLSGFMLPTQRACLMLALLIFTGLCHKTVNRWRIWSIALIAVLLINPLSVLTESFWLSFATIALIIYGMQQRLNPIGWWWSWCRVQWVIGLGLIPLSFILFQQCSLISFIANTIAIPWLTFLVLPFCILGTLWLFIFPAIGEGLLWIADKSMSGLYLWLSMLNHVPHIVWTLYLPIGMSAILMVIGVILLLLPNGFPGKAVGFIWLLPALLQKPASIEPGNMVFTLLDVGQGLSAIIQTHSHTLIYDTGARFMNGTDMGAAIVLPYLRTQKITRIDAIIISHGDNDHIGGLQAIQQTLPINAIYTSVPDKISYPNVLECERGKQWQWDGIHFTFLYPDSESSLLGNDRSCVLRIDNGVHSILLTGDIEKAAEKNLFLHDPNALQTEIMVAPHHGSKSSGWEPFIHAVNPQSVFYAVGYRNRYHFPHPSVVKTYQSLGVKEWNSIECGTMRLDLDKNNNALLPMHCYRKQQHRYWFDD